MGREFVDAPRKPLSEYVGAAKEFTAYPGAPDKPVPWDPIGFSLLHKVSANNPDVAWLREAELKHGRVAMLAFVGILVQASGKHFPARVFEEVSSAQWPDALSKLASDPDGVNILAQAVATIGLIEGQTLAAKGEGKGGRMDLWYGERPGGVVAGDYGFDPLKLLSTDKRAADIMKTKEVRTRRRI